jgi:UDP-GlcNAc:undecaprenyl-phosphate GlcNAc-1-phosphate transferase
MGAMIPTILGLAAAAFVAGACMTALMMVLGRRLGALDSAGAAGHSKVLRDVPNTGGLAIFLTVAAALCAGLAAAWAVGPATWSRLGLEGVLMQAAGEGQTLLDRVRASTPVALAMVALMALLCLVGAIDDRRSLNPWLKLAVEAGVAVPIVLWCEVRLLSFLGSVPSALLTVLWIVVVVNAVNFIDNMDGLAGGVSAIAAALFAAACVVNRQWLIAATLALLVGALCGFLVFNFPPARIFMGDAGSLVVGFLLAVLTVRTTYYDPQLGGGWYGVFMPLLVLAVPLYDLVSVTLIRLAQGRSPMVGDQRHLSHRLVQRGLSPRGAVVVIWAATAVAGIGGISLGSLAAWQAILVAAQTCLLLAMIALLEYASRRSVARDGPS